LTSFLLQLLGFLRNTSISLGLVKVRLAAIPPLAFSDTPVLLTTYYRHAIDDDYATFTLLNDTTTYSSMPDMPASWIFESMRTVIDLDNILLSDLPPSIPTGPYVLTNILSEGVCLTADGELAEGAELALLNGRDDRTSDTIVMRSNGYWQLAAHLGVWRADLGGRRSRTIYELPASYLSVHSFARQTSYVFVQVRPGMEGMNVYHVTTADPSNMTRVDVFSVASGHLYERLLKIMMLAVRRQSQFFREILDHQTVSVAAIQSDPADHGLKV
jgi:UDP-glucose:glycoprotein glucosyltransferase